MEAKINLILVQMQQSLEPSQFKQLKNVLEQTLIQTNANPITNDALLERFISAKTVEGCSLKTINYYRNTLVHLEAAMNKSYTQVTSDELRSYLNNYEQKRQTGKTTIDNIRRILSSFYSWLEDEDYIVKSPVRRIHKVKTAIVEKVVLTDEELEAIRESCTTSRDLAIVDLLASTGMRVGELVNLDIADVDFQERECLVTGKGNKQRLVYFDARTKIHLKQYLTSRNDDNAALFVNLTGDNSRISINAVELRLRDIGRRANVTHVHPHKFRRTLATQAIGKGMPIEQVQVLLGHKRIDTTMHYAMVNQNNVKTSHRRYLE